MLAFISSLPCKYHKDHCRLPPWLLADTFAQNSYRTVTNHHANRQSLYDISLLMYRSTAFKQINQKIDRPRICVFFWYVTCCIIIHNAHVKLQIYSGFLIHTKLHLRSYTAIACKISELNIFGKKILRNTLSLQHEGVCVCVWGGGGGGAAMMTSSNGIIFRVTGHLCGEFTGHRWIPCTKASHAELWCFLWSAPE